MLAEERLDLAVESTRLGPGEQVIIVTKMGHEIGRGTVQDIHPHGSVYVKLSDAEGKLKEDRIFDPTFYSFVPMEDEKPKETVDPEQDPGLDVDTDPPEQSLEELPFDERAKVKIQKLNISLEANGDEANGEKDAGGNGKAAASDAGSDDVRGDTRQPETKVDVDALPETIKKKIVGVKGLDEAQRDRVLSEISDAALRALKNVGVKDIEIYKTVSRIQEAVSPVLQQKK